MHQLLDMRRFSIDYIWWYRFPHPCQFQGYCIVSPPSFLEIDSSIIGERMTTAKVSEAELDNAKNSAEKYVEFQIEHSDFSEEEKEAMVPKASNYEWDRLICQINPCIIFL